MTTKYKQHKRELSLKHVRSLLMILSVVLLVEVSFGAELTPYSKDFGKDVAKSTSILLRNSRNLNGFLNSLKPFYTPKDIRKARRLLQENGISYKTKMPSFKVSGSKIIFDKENYIDFISPSLLIANGHKIRMEKLSLNQSVAKIVKIFNRPKKTSFVHDLVFPKAYALNTMQGLIVGVAAGATGAYLGESWFGWDKWIGAAVGVGVVYLLSELMQSNKDGEVSCSSGGGYQIRKKGRNALFMAAAEYDDVPESQLTAAGLPATCDPSRAARLQTAIEYDQFVYPEEDETNDETVEPDPGTYNRAIL